MSENPESAVLRAIAEIEAEDSRDEIAEIVRWQLKSGLKREKGARPDGVVGRTDRRLPWMRYSEGFAGGGSLPPAIEDGPVRIDDGPPYVYGRDYSLAPGSTYGWVDEHGVVHTEVVADGPDFTDPVRRARDRIAEIRHVVSLAPPPAPHAPGLLGLIRDAAVALWGRR